MNTVEKIKNDRINLRLKSSAKSLLERAASFEGKTISHFILNCALIQAEETVRKHESLVLSVRDSETFINALSKPLNINKSLMDALNEHSKRVVSK